MLAANLELRGPSRVDWIEQAYFADRTRTLPEIQAALLALGVHGDGNATVPRRGHDSDHDEPVGRYCRRVGGASALCPRPDICFAR